MAIDFRVLESDKVYVAVVSEYSNLIGIFVGTPTDLIPQLEIVDAIAYYDGSQFTTDFSNRYTNPSISVVELDRLKVGTGISFNVS